MSSVSATPSSTSAYQAFSFSYTHLSILQSYTQQVGGTSITQQSRLDVDRFEFSGVNAPVSGPPSAGKGDNNGLFKQIQSAVTQALQGTQTSSDGQPASGGSSDLLKTVQDAIVGVLRQRFSRPAPTGAGTPPPPGDGTGNTPPPPTGDSPATTPTSSTTTPPTTDTTTPPPGTNPPTGTTPPPPPESGEGNDGDGDDAPVRRRPHGLHHGHHYGHRQDLEHSSSRSGVQNFFRTLQSFGIDPQQFRDAFLAAVREVFGSIGNTNPAPSTNTGTPPPPPAPTPSNPTTPTPTTTPTTNPTIDTLA